MAEIADFLSEPFSSPERWSTGLHVLDEFLGGMVSGHLWLIIGSPGEGKSTLLTQLAFRMAVDHGAHVSFASPLEDADLVRGRLLALAGAGSLRYPDPGVTGSRSVERVEELRRATFDVQVGGGFGGPTWSPTDAVPQCWAVDDAQYAGRTFAEELRRAAASGAFVLASLPRDEVIAGPVDAPVLVQRWASVADVIIEVQSSASETGAPGDALLLIHRNRRGPTPRLSVANQVWRARFVDCAS